MAKHLTDKDKCFCDKPITQDEVETAIMHLKTSKSPGLDGLTPEFYKYFWPTLMPLFHQRIKPRSCLRPLIVGSLGKNGKKIDQWGGRQNRCEGLGLTTDRPQDAPGGSRQSLTGLGLRTD